MTVTCDKEITALLVIAPYNDFISEGGKTMRSTSPDPPLSRAILTGGRGINRIAVSGWRRSASDGFPPAISRR
jgi:hypothetical protein